MNILKSNVVELDSLSRLCSEKGFDKDKLRGQLMQTDDLNEYKQFLQDSMKEMHRVMKKGKYCIIEVGDIRHQAKKLYLDHIIVELAKPNKFEVEKVIINYMEAPKISKAFSRKSKYGGTKTNRCVVMKKL